MAGAAWVGADGNIYTRVSGQDGVANLGGAQGTGILITRPGGQWHGLDVIPDPNPPQKTPMQQTNAPTAPSNPNGYSSSGSAVAAKPDKSNDIAINQAGLGSVDAQTAAGLSAVDKALSGVLGSYDTESGANHDNYKVQSDTNQNNRQSGIQSAYLNATQGRQGLFGTMASMGMLNGDGIKLANRAVQSGANEDLSGVDGNFKTNQTGLDTAIHSFEQQDAERRKQANTSAEDAKSNINNNGANNKLKFYGQLASDYADEGDTTNAKKYTDMASSLYPTIASTSIPSTNIGYQGAAYQPGALGNYTINGSTVSTSNKPDAFGIPTLFASPNQKKQSA